MAWRIVKQPNGKLARFSDIVDNFTHYDMTEKEAYELCRFYLGIVESEDKVKRGTDDIEPWSNSEKGDGLSRWRDCLKSIELVHGIEEKEKVEEIMGPMA